MDSTVTAASTTASTPYDPVPLRGLSYQGIGTDPTFGAVQLDASVSTAGYPFSGKIDALSFRALPCQTCEERGR